MRSSRKYVHARVRLFVLLLTPYQQIREELVYHNIRLYPFDTEESDEEEVQLNESIRVRLPFHDSPFSAPTISCRA